jgi:hypothetical protein
MPSYLFLAAAVIVIIAIGVVGILLIRRGRRAAQEDIEQQAATQTSTPSPFHPVPPPLAGPQAIPGSLVPGQSISAQPMAEAGDQALTPAAVAPAASGATAAVDAAQDYLQGVEQLLVEWRARHELSVVRGNAAAKSAPRARCDQAAAFDSEAPIVSRPGIAGPAVAVASETPPLDDREHGVSLPPVFDPGEYEIGAADLTTHAVLLDPLGVVILDMVDGKGKLDAADLKRLEVFRPERIELTARTLELPPRWQNDDDVVLRLAQIQLYAATLELRSKWAARMPAHGDGPQGSPFSARDFKLKIARDIMDLPLPDRSEVIGYLLGGLLTSQGSSVPLKRAVIDTLENLHSAALVNVLLDCLDDPDPIVQEYALAAADRLLDR